MQFTKASRRKAHLKIAITGPTGAGKTYSSILLARGLAGADGRIAFIDTENGSGELYSHLTDYDCGYIDPKNAAPHVFIEAIDAAVKDGYDVIVIDSLSHAWKAILSEKEALDARGGNSFTNWGKLKPKAEALKSKIVSAAAHVVVCMRSKMEYELVQDGTKSKVNRVGMGVVQENDIEYEFTTVFDLDVSHRFVATKDRTSIFDGRSGQMITADTGREFITWLDSGAEPLAVSTNGEVSTKDWLKSILKSNDDRDKWAEVSKPLGTPIAAAKLAMAAGVKDAADLFNWAALETPRAEQASDAADAATAEADQGAHEQQQQEAANAVMAKVADQLVGAGE